MKHFLKSSIIALAFSGAVLAGGPCDGNPRVTQDGSSISCLPVELPALDSHAVEADPSWILRLNVKALNVQTTSIIVTIEVMHLNGTVKRTQRTVVGLGFIPMNVNFTMAFAAGDIVNLIQINEQAMAYPVVGFTN